MNELVLQLLKRFGMESGPFNEGDPLLSRLLGTDPLTPEDEPYLRQYLGVPKDGGLSPASRARPTSLSGRDNLPWYRPTFNPVKELMVELPTTGTQVFGGPDTAPQSAEAVDRLPIGEAIKLWNPLAPGLGGYTASVGRDPTGPYMSVYDKWDFDSPVVSPLVREVMKRMGKPYHVYGRYPLIKTEKGYRPHSGAEDIELPAGR